MAFNSETFRHLTSELSGVLHVRWSDWLYGGLSCLVNLSVTNARRGHLVRLTLWANGLNLVLGMNDLIRAVFKLLAHVSVSRRLLEKRVRPIWFYPYNDKADRHLECPVEPLVRRSGIR